MRHTQVLAILLSCMLSFITNVSVAQYGINGDISNNLKLLAVTSTPYGTVIEDHVALKAGPFDREATIGFLYKNDEFRIEDTRHITYLEVTVMTSQDAGMPGMRGWIAREFTAW